MVIGEDYTIYNGGAFPANRATDGMTSGTSVSLNFKTRPFAERGKAGWMDWWVFFENPPVTLW